jgi:hypothetical protein
MTKGVITMSNLELELWEMAGEALMLARQSLIERLTSEEQAKLAGLEERYAEIAEETEDEDEDEEEDA